MTTAPPRRNTTPRSQLSLATLATHLDGHCTPIPAPTNHCLQHNKEQNKLKDQEWFTHLQTTDTHTFDRLINSHLDNYVNLLLCHYTHYVFHFMTAIVMVSLRSSANTSIETNIYIMLLIHNFISSEIKWRSGSLPESQILLSDTGSTLCVR